MTVKQNINITYYRILLLSVITAFTIISLGSIKQARAITPDNLNEARNGARIECAKARKQATAVRRYQQDLANARQRYERAKAALRRESTNLRRVSNTYRRLLPRFKRQARLCKESKQSYEIMKQMLGGNRPPPTPPINRSNRRQPNTPQRGLLGIEAPPVTTRP